MLGSINRPVHRGLVLLNSPYIQTTVTFTGDPQVTFAYDQLGGANSTLSRVRLN